MKRLTRKAPIPKWIDVEIKVLSRAFTTSQAPEEPVKPVVTLDKDLVPLTDLAMILSSNLDTAIAKGLYDPKMKLKKTRLLEAGLLSTTSSCSILESLHASLGDVAIDLILVDYEC